MKKKILILFSVFLSSFVFCQTAYAAVTWSETQPAGYTDQNWAGVKISRGGNVILAAINYGRLYVSRDSGASLEEALSKSENSSF